MEQYCLWIDRDQRVISFREQPGFSRMTFADRDAMMAYALDISGFGYRIQ